MRAISNKCYVRPSKPQISLRIRAVWSEPLLVAWVSMIAKLLTEHHLEFLSLKGGCRGSSESTLVKMSNCWKSQVLAHFCLWPNQCSTHQYHHYTTLKINKNILDYILIHLVMRIILVLIIYMWAVKMWTNQRICTVSPELNTHIQ